MNPEWSEQAAGVRLTAPAVPKVELRSIIAEAVRTAAPDVDTNFAAQVSNSVAESLAAPQVLEEIATAFVRALHRASDAYMQRDDIYEYPGNLETAGRVAADALSELLGRTPAQPATPDPQQAAALLAEVTYPGLAFEYVHAPYPRVIARGEFPDSSDPDRDFPVSQYAVVKGDLIEAAFAAVMNLLDHEAREAFRYRGDRVFNAHGDQGETSGPILKQGAEPDTRRSYSADIGPSAGIRARRAPAGGS